MADRIGSGNRAIDLRVAPFTNQRRHSPLVPVGGLFDKPRPIDGASIQPRRSAGLQPRHGQGSFAQLCCKNRSCALPYPPTFEPLLTPEKNTAQECACAQDRSVARQFNPAGQTDTMHRSALDAQARDLSFNNLERLLRRYLRTHCGTEEFAIGLYPRAPDRTALRPVEHPVMNCARICSDTQHAIESIDLADEMALPQATDSRIAAHRANLACVHRHQCDTHTHPGCDAGRFHAGVAAADNNDRVVLHGTPIMGATGCR